MSAIAPTYTRHIDRLREARRRTYGEKFVASIVEPTGTFPVHIVTSPYFFVGPRRPHALDVIRLVCDAEQRNPRDGEVVSYAGTSTRIIGSSPDTLTRGRCRSVTFTCHGTEDVVRSCGLVTDYERRRA